MKKKRRQRKKREETCLSRYGNKHVLSYFKEDIKKTIIDKYGGYTMQSDKLKQKVKETVLNKYGCENTFQSEECKEKSKKTSLERYGKEFYCQTEKGRKELSEKIKEGMEKFRDRLEEKYGERYVMQVPEFFEKRLNTMKQRHSFKTSHEEQCMIELVTEIFGEDDVQTQFKDDRYPFNCDIYVQSLDCFIEYNGSQYHHGRIYEGTQKDLQEVEQMKKRGYDNIVYDWTVRDVKKVKVSKENGINMLWIYRDWDKNWLYFCRTNNSEVKKEIKEKLKILIKETKGFKTL